MALCECKNCRYCQKRWNRDRYGNFVDGYYGCNHAPHWGKNFEKLKPEFN